MNQDDDDKETNPFSSEPAAATSSAPDTATQQERWRCVAESSGTLASGTDGAEAEIAERAYKVEFGACKSLRYHAKRRRWFENWHTAAMATSVVSASAAFASVSGIYPNEFRWVAIALALFTALDLVVGFYRRAELHSNLYRRFSALLAEMMERLDPSEVEVRRWEAERIRIQADEPTSLDTLNVMCHNDEAEARGLGAEHIYSLRWLDRLLAPIGSIRLSYRKLE